MEQQVDGRFSGQVALVTGALNGIGLAISQRLAREGATVLLSDLAGDADPLARERLSTVGGKARYLQLDVTSESAWQAAAASIGAGEGRLDILIHNAGTTTNGSIEELSLEAWRRVQAVNSDSIFLGTRAFAVLLSDSGRDRKEGASIVVISSILGLVGFANAAPYTASKGAARLLTKALAVEFAGRDLPIRVNSVHPGFVGTRLTLDGLDRIARENGLADARPIIADINAQTPLKRMGEPEEVAAVVAFLCSGDASYMTGSELVVDGGYTAR